ncbi:MAG: hypothetical protein C1942_04925 [Prosthecochloris sp.]|nr:hypothetical protein [Prosthecochloris sp.]
MERICLRFVNGNGTGEGRKAKKTRKERLFVLSGGQVTGADRGRIHELFLGYLPFPAIFSLPITNHQSPITNHQSPITNHQSPITNHQSPITNHIIFWTVKDISRLFCGYYF